jgi:hypothetical protein
MFWRTVAMWSFQLFWTPSHHSEIPFVGLGGLAQLVRLRLGGVPSGFDVLFELGARLRLGGSSPVLCLLGSGRQLGELV